MVVCIVVPVSLEHTADGGHDYYAPVPTMRQRVKGMTRSAAVAKLPNCNTLDVIGQSQMGNETAPRMKVTVANGSCKLRYGDEAGPRCKISSGGDVPFVVLGHQPN